MHAEPPAHSWFGPSVMAVHTEEAEDPRAYRRLWQGFMTARLFVGLVLLLLQLAMVATHTAYDWRLVAVSGLYLGGALLTRFALQPRPLDDALNRPWLMLVGLDVAVFYSLQWMHGNSINYTPLFVLPILLASVLGSLRLALATAASVTTLLLAGSAWRYLSGHSLETPYLVQFALSGVGYFAIALLANQLAVRLASEGQRARQSQLAARIQQQVNELVIESLPDGVLIVNEGGTVRAANPTARQMLGTPHALRAPYFDLADEPGWRALVELTRTTVGLGQSQVADVSLHAPGQSPRRVHVRTRLAAPQGMQGESLCVLFLQDQREIEARMRTEKLASMGRMSTAVAHEIRNPLAAITQANALLAEELQSPQHHKLTAMVAQNAKRLDKIVCDILNVARIQPQHPDALPPRLDLRHSSEHISRDWAVQNHCVAQLHLELPPQACSVVFDAEHLRRLLINLLDNALRYAHAAAQTIQISLEPQLAHSPQLTLWSEGAPMDPSVERHLFEPFFSSESRSSGLGLYICRELCTSHGATIRYQRQTRTARGQPREGNAFTIVFRAPQERNSPPPRTAPWQATPH